MNALSEKQIYRFADVEVDLSRNCLLQNGKEKHLRQKTFQVLVYLLKHRERLITKNELIETVWKDTAVTDDVLVQCIKEIRRSIGDDSHEPRFIKTVPKSGYRFIGEIEENLNGGYIEEITKVEFEIEEEFDTDSVNKVIPLLAKSNSFDLARYFPLLIILLIAVVIGIGIFTWRSTSSKAEIRLPKIDGKKTIAVMFFENQSNNTELDWLCEGLPDMLIADLSRSEKLTILSRIQLHSLTEKQSLQPEISLEQAKEIARRTQAEYFIMGSFAKIGERVRIDIQLYDSENANLQVTETLTVEKTDQILTEIDLLSLKIASRLNAPPTEKRDLASVMTNNLEAYRYYSLAIEKAQVLQNKEALELLEKAVALDPQFAMAHARIGYVYALSIGNGEKGKPFLEKAFKLSERLTEKDRLSIKAWYEIANLDFPAAIQTYREIIAKYPLETESYWRLGRLLEGENQSAEAIEVLKQGLNIDPQSKVIYNHLGGVYSKNGNHKEAISAHLRYLAFAPNEPNAYDSLGLSFQWAGDYPKAIENYRRALEINPKFEVALVHLANSHFQLGQYRTAEALYRRYIEIAPSENEKARGWNCLAYLFYKKREFISAEKASREFHKISQEDYGLRYFIAAEKGDVNSANHLEKMIPIETKHNNRGSRTTQRFDLFLRGYIALKKNRNEKALEYFRQIIQAKPPTWNHETYEDSLANALLQLGKPDEAIAEYQRILQLNPNFPLAQFHLAQAYQAKGLIAEANSAYRNFLEIWKDADSDIPEIVTTRKALGYQ